MGNGHKIHGTSICVDHWPSTPNNKKYHHFLTHLHKDHTVKMKSTFHGTIFTSPFNAWFLRRWFDISPKRIVALSVGDSHVMYDDSGTPFSVTLFDANHCPGSVMFLFQGRFGNILYTGHFRYDPRILQHPMLKSLIENEAVDMLYLDNTFAAEHCEFPPREQALKQVIKVIKDHPDHNILLGGRKLGQEEVLRAIALELKEKISVSSEKLEILKKLGYESDFTVNSPDSRIFVMDMDLINARSIDNLRAQKGPVLTILLTAFYPPHVQNSSPSAEIDKGIHKIPYSDHSCHSELVEFVSKIRPKIIFPIVKATGNKIGSRQSGDLPRIISHSWQNSVIPKSITCLQTKTALVDPESSLEYFYSSDEDLSLNAASDQTNVTSKQIISSEGISEGSHMIMKRVQTVSESNVESQPRSICLCTICSDHPPENQVVRERHITFTSYAPPVTLKCNSFEECAPTLKPKAKHANMEEEDETYGSVNSNVLSEQGSYDISQNQLVNNLNKQQVISNKKVLSRKSKLREKNIPKLISKTENQSDGTSFITEVSTKRLRDLSGLNNEESNAIKDSILNMIFGPELLPTSKENIPKISHINDCVQKASRSVPKDQIAARVKFDNDQSKEGGNYSTVSDSEILEMLEELARKNDQICKNVNPSTSKDIQISDKFEHLLVKKFQNRSSGSGFFPSLSENKQKETYTAYSPLAQNSKVLLGCNTYRSHPSRGPNKNVMKGANSLQECSRGITIGFSGKRDSIQEKTSRHTVEFGEEDINFFENFLKNHQHWIEQFEKPETQHEKAITEN